MLFSYELGVLQSGPPVPDAPLTAYANALGTGDRTASITVTSTITPFTGTLSNLVDGGFGSNSTDAFNLPAVTAINNGDYIRFDFVVKKYIDEFKIYVSSAASMGIWVFQGSDDASSWTTYGSFTWDVATETVALSGMTPYGHRYWQLLENDTGQSLADVWYQEFEFKIADGAIYP